MSSLPEAEMDNLANASSEMISGAGLEVRRFEASHAWSMMQWRLENLRRVQEGIMYSSNSAADSDKFRYAMGVVQTVEKVYQIFDDILEEAARANEHSSREA